ncbi:kynurenine formamidase [Cimex lectularius]|uniref:Alpha/beta hydrolase fold-3 domain-containing protein n=1 Tax=Cimex lectularius TaxID=79782 RepID=A0A8I6R8M0_CIMLE|nr:kynurenine formamidase [Cimex lectularius]
MSVVIPKEEEFRRQYRPRLWCKRLPENVVVNRHMEVTSEASETNRKCIPFESDVSYGSKKTELVDIYGKDSVPKDAPIFVYIHGGYWYMIEKNVSSYCARPLWKNGIRVFVPDYDLAPGATMKEMVTQIQKMAKFVLEYAVRNGSKSVWFGGHSAGGHLSASLLDENWLKSVDKPMRDVFKGLILISGIYDLIPILRTEFNDYTKMSYEDAVENSPVTKVTDFIGKLLINPDFKVLFVLAENDSEAFKQQSCQYFKLLKKVQIEAEYFLIPEVDHFDMVENLNEESFILTKRLISLVKGLE